MTIDSQLLRAERHTRIGLLIQQDAGILIERWCQRAIQEQPDARRLHHEALRDQLPDLLLALGRSLAESDEAETSRHRLPAREHGEQRWQTGWSLPELVRDYQILRLVIFEYLEATLERSLRPHEVMAIGLALDEAIAASVASYVRHREAFLLHTERAHAEEERRAREALRKWEEMFQHAGWGMALVGADDPVLHAVNPAFARMHGHSAEQLIGKSLAEVLTPESQAELWAQLRQADANGGHVYESIHVRADGAAFPVLTDLAPVRGPDGQLVYRAANFQDLTRQKELEQSLRQRAEALKEKDRRKDEFLAVLGHELRNPLASIVNALEMLRLAGSADPKIVQARDVVDRQVRQMVRLVDDLLDVARISQGKIELRRQRFDLAAAVGQAVQTVRPLIEDRRHHLDVQLPATPLWLETDQARVVQVLVNLLSNAAKYTEPGGRIGLTAERDGPQAVVRVRDTGIGIPPDMLTRIFGLYTQLDPARDVLRGGLGIGLTLVHRLVQLLGGDIQASSDGPGRGSEFVVRLPALAEPEAAPPAADNPKGKAAGACHVLVIEDNPDGRETLRVLLTLMGHRVETAANGPAGLEAARTSCPQVALIDIGLPEMDGYQVARTLRGEFGSRILLVALSGFGRPDDCPRAGADDFDAYLTKPVEVSELSRVLARAPSLPLARS